jgi:hypothetical protein
MTTPLPPPKPYDPACPLCKGDGVYFTFDVGSLVPHYKPIINQQLWWVRCPQCIPPNATTIKAIQEADSGKNMARYESVEEMTEDLSSGGHP